MNFKHVAGMGFKVKDASKIKNVVRILISSNDRSERRRKAAAIERAKRGDIPAFTGDASLIYERQEVRELLLGAISKLLPRQQELFRKIFIEGRTMADVAREEGVRYQAIQNRLSKIRRQIQKYLTSMK